MQGHPSLVVPAREAEELVVGTDGLAVEDTRAVWVGSAGDLVVDMATTGATITFVGIVAGTLLPIAIKHVHFSSTAGSLVALR